MTRSRRRKLERAQSTKRLPVAAKRFPAAARRLPIASALLAVLPGAYAADQAQTGAPAAATAQTDTGAQSSTTGSGLEEVVVTAEKRTENLQTVPLSIQTLDTQKLEDLNITDIDDYVKYLSGVTTVKGLGQGGTGVGTTHEYIRGVVSGQDGNHSGSQPTVGTYFDEMPITTIDGTIDLHTYDIQRIEVLEGPQGTLYGASSEAGTIRIITNKPDPSKFSAAYDVFGDSVDGGGQGWGAEGYANIPLGPIAAVRLVGWDEHDPGYIHNIAGTNLNAGIVDGVRTFPTSGLSISNASTLDDQYNTQETRGGRVTGRVNLLDDNLIVTPLFMGQEIDAHGFNAYDPAVGPYDLVHFGPEGDKDSFTMSALTIEGHVSNFDITYAGGWMLRNEHTLTDYSDYSYFYDKYFGSGCLWVTQAGYNYVNSHAATAPGACYSGTKYPAGSYAEPQEYVITNGKYTKASNELRVSTPPDWPVNGIVGLFLERQLHDIWEQYTIPGAGGNPYTQNPQGFAPSLDIPGVNGNTIWLTDQERVDRDKAAFGQFNWDITKSWQITGGIRFYQYNNSLQGFYGYSGAYQDFSALFYPPGLYPGQNICTVDVPFHGAPCQDLNQTVSGNGKTYKATATYKFDADKLLYATYSTGYRPGGVNRVYDAVIHALYPPYQPDYLKNYEIGWKTQWDEHKLRWNGALFWDNWDNFQFLFLGPNSVTVVQNAASARIRGIENQLEWAPIGGLSISSQLTWLQAVTTANYCGPQATIPGTSALSTNCPNQINSYADGSAPNGPEAPSGTELPVTPKFKANLVARYSMPLGNWLGFAQAAEMYQTSAEPLLRLIDQEKLGEMPSYANLDLSIGAQWNSLQWELALNNAFNKIEELTRFVECATTTCGPQPYIIPAQPRTVMIKFSEKF